MSHLLHALMLRAAKPYVAGETLADALAMAHAAKARGATVTLGYWHDDAEPAEVVADTYIAAIAALADSDLDGRIAMKVPGLKGRMDLVDRVLGAGHAVGIGIDIDSHAPEQADEAFAAAGRGAPGQIGIAVPGRWAHGPDLAARAVEMGLRVRVVKGSWADPAAPRLDPATGYLAVTDRLATLPATVAVATHDAPLAAAALDRLAAAGTAHAQELLYGLPMEPAAAEGRNRGLAPRLYIPYGHAWVPYSLRRALQSPATLARFVQDLATGNRDGLPNPPGR